MAEILSPARVVQIAYFVNDIKAAAKKANAMFGYGPFYVYENIKLRDVSYRGEAAELDHSSAYGQAGDLMIEFVQQNNEGPSALTDMYPNGEEGLHHMAMFVDNVQKEMQRMENLGFQTANHYFAPGKVEVAFIDTHSALGHMIEVYEPVQALKDFYAMVATSSKNWDGKELFRNI